MISLSWMKLLPLERGIQRISVQGDYGRAYYERQIGERHAEVRVAELRPPPDRRRVGRSVYGRGKAGVGHAPVYPNQPSSRSTVIGSTRVARLAGIQAANNPTRVISTQPTASATGSSADT